jgi:transposase
MADQTPDSLVPTESPSYKRLTDADRITILHLHDDGLTLTAIAQRLGRSVSTIHDVVQTYAPTTDLAKRKLAAASERMAENIIANGQPRDHVATLKGLGVLADDSGLKVQIAVGVSLPGLPTQSEGPQKR